MEQLVARRAHNPKVAGSSPAPATLKIKELDKSDSFFLYNGYNIGTTNLTLMSSGTLLNKGKN